MSTADLRLDGQAAIVTGASSGLGVIIARGLAALRQSAVLASEQLTATGRPVRTSVPRKIEAMPLRATSDSTR